MTYAKGGKVQFGDLNSFTATFNNIWSTGSGNSGYGQTGLSTVSYGEKVRANNYWRALVQNTESVASHQGSSIAAMTPTPTTSNKIEFLSNLSSNLTTVNNNRLNAVASGSTSTTTLTSVETWNNSLTMTFTVTFSNNNSARYFFNAGGQIGFNFSHPDTGNINTLISDICSETGTVWVSSTNSGAITIAGTSYNGVTKVGGISSARETINTNFGFYAFNSTSTEIFKQTGDAGTYSAYLDSFLQIKASTNNAGILTFVCVIDEVPNGAEVAAGTVGTLTLRPPSTTYLVNSWGTPSVSGSIIAASSGAVVFGDTTVNRSTSTRSGSSYSWTVPNGVSLLTISAAGGGGGSYGYHDGGYCQGTWAGGPGGGVENLQIPVTPGDVISGVYGSAGGSGFYNGGTGIPGTATTILKNGSLVATCGPGGQASTRPPAVGTTTIQPGYTGTATTGTAQTTWLVGCDGTYPFDNHYDPWSWVLGGSYAQSSLGTVATEAPALLGLNYQRAGMPQVCGWVYITY